MPKHTEEERKEIRRRIRYYQERGISARKIAKSLGLHQTVVSYYIRQMKQKASESTASLLKQSSPSAIASPENIIQLRKPPPGQESRRLAREQSGRVEGS